MVTRFGEETRHISVIGTGSKQLTGTAVDKTELNFGTNVPSLFSFSVNSLAITLAIHGEQCNQL